MGEAHTGTQRGAAQARSEAAWGVQSKGEQTWPVTLAVVLSAFLYITLPAKLTFGPAWLVPALELALLIPLRLVHPLRYRAEDVWWRRPLATSLIGLINLTNIWSLGLLVHELVNGGPHVIGTKLLLGAVQIWLTNILVFALWYWELDRGGPIARMSAQHAQPDFLFPQMVTPGSTHPGWTPKFVDYLFVSFTNATAFSPTDTMPLTTWAKLLFMVQALAALLTVALVAARAVNILT